MPFSMFEIWQAFLSKIPTSSGEEEQSEFPTLLGRGSRISRENGVEHTLDSLYQLMVDRARITWFDIDLANGCNLTCNHCFYHDNYSEWTEAPLSRELLEEAIRQAMQAQISVLTFSGKEPTLSKNLELAIQSARRARDRYAPEAKVGMITNGLTLPQLMPFLEKEPPNFIDISIDGWDYHNLIRANTRDRVIANLKLAKQKLSSTRVGTSTVVRNDNVLDVIKMIDNLAEFSNYFYFEPVVAAVDKSIASLTEDNLVLFVTELHKLAQKFQQRDIHFSILLNGDQALPLFYRGLLEPEDIEEDELGSLFIRRQFGKVQIDYILRIIPEYFWKSARLSYDGYWLGTCDLLQAPNFRELAVGSFAETPNFRQLFERSLQKDSLFYHSLEQLFFNPCEHTPREKQYCLSCFSNRMVQYMHRHYSDRWSALPLTIHA